jgi:hypothetical protein
MIALIGIIKLAAILFLIRFIAKWIMKIVSELKDVK